MTDFKEECTGCGACKDVCPFLAEFGTPDLILSERPEISFFCTSCHRCDTVCPLKLSPAAALFETKQRLVQQQQLPSSIRKPLEGARAFAKTGHRFPFSFYGTADTVFWPGCGMAANRPGLVRRLQETLSRYLETKVGLVLDCCFDPVYACGDTVKALAALQEIDKRLRAGGVSRVVTGCLNCHKLLSRHLGGIEVVFILEILPMDLFKPYPGTDVYLHHPCPSARWQRIRRAARDLSNYLFLSGGIDRTFAQAPEAAFSNAATNDDSENYCCGAGGGLCSFSPALAERFLDRIVEEGANRIIVTYCTGCQNRFLKRGVEAVHLLECLPGVKPRRGIPSPTAQWGNRLILALRSRMNPGKLLVGLMIILLIVGGFYVQRQHVYSVENLTDLLSRHPVLAPLIFLGVYALTPSLFLPSIPLTLAAGFFWGPVWGVVFSISGATIGACLPFFLSRYLFQNAVKSKVPEKSWEWLQNRVIQHGWKAVAFTRLIPAFPFNLLNYLFGLTPIPFRQYLWSTFVFMLPACIAFVAFGSSLGELIMRGNVKGVAIGMIVAVCALLLPIALRPFFHKIGQENTAAGSDEKPPGGKDT
jgi:uncharacterized membrane protein YdjX (TVP38/TMEM64 family)/Fe-S oxidoreductase